MDIKDEDYGGRGYYLPRSRRTPLELRLLRPLGLRLTTYGGVRFHQGLSGSWPFPLWDRSPSSDGRFCRTRRTASST